MANTLNIEDLNASLGAYCRTNTNTLLGGIVVGNKSFEHFVPMLGVKDQAPIVDIRMGNILKPYNKNWTPNADAAKVVPRIMQVRTCKVEVELEPLAYHHTYLGQFLKAGTDPNDLPFEKYLMQKIVEGAAQQLELQGIFHGEYNAAGQTPGSTMNGLNTIVEAEIAAGNITPIVTGAINAVDAVGAIEGMFYSIPEEYQAAPLKMFVSPKLKHWYNIAYREAYGAHTASVQFDKQFIDGTQCEIVAMPGLAGSNRIHLTTPGNVFYGTDLASDMDTVRTQLDKWTMIVMLSFKIGVQIGSLEGQYWTNDQN
jgi:hypothetical protein